MEYGVEYEEQRTLFTQGRLTVSAVRRADEDSDVEDVVFDDPERAADYVRRYRAGDWRFVELEVAVTWEGREIGTASNGGVEHGDTDGTGPVDCWQWTPARYPRPDAVDQGSPLAAVVCEALRDAERFVDGLGLTAGAEGVNGALHAAWRWADPNHPDRRDSVAVPAAPEGRDGA